MLLLAQALAQMGWRDAPRLWVLTRGAQVAGPADKRAEVAQAPLWGLARTLAIEHPELACTSLDLAIEDMAGDAGAIFDTIWEAGAEDQIALPDCPRHVAPLMRWRPGGNAPRRGASPA